MNKRRVSILLAVMALVLASLACNAVTGNGGGDNTNGGSLTVTTANIQNAHMSTDEKDSAQTTTYAASAKTFYCYFDLKNAPETTVVKGAWTLVSAEGYTSNSEIDSAEITGSDNTYYFSLDRSGDSWPVGKYKIDLYIDGNLVQTLNFEVK